MWITPSLLEFITPSAYWIKLSFWVVTATGHTGLYMSHHLAEECIHICLYLSVRICLFQAHINTTFLKVEWFEFWDKKLIFQNSQIKFLVSVFLQWLFMKTYSIIDTLQLFQILLYTLKESESVNHSVVSDSVIPKLPCPWDCHSLLQRIFPTQDSTLCLLHCRQILYCLSHQGNRFLCWLRP